MRERHDRPNLTRLTRLGFVNAYLVSEDDGLTLVDTMISGSAPGILAAAERLGRPIVRVVLTHAHSDHAGSLDAVAGRLPAAEIAVSAREARLLAGDHALEAGEPDSKLRGGWPKVAVSPTRLLEHGDRVGSLRVVAARLGTAARGSAVTLVVRPDDNTLPATVTVGPSTLRIRGTTSLICSLAPAPSHRLSVTYRGSTLEVAVDDRSATTVQLATTAGSGIGIGAWRDSARSPEPVVRKLTQVSPTASRIAKARLKCTTDIAPPASSRDSRTQPSNGSTLTGDLSSGTPSRRIWRNS